MPSLCSHFVLVLVLVLVLSHCACACAAAQNGETMGVSEYVSSYLGIDYENRWYFTLSTFLFGVVFRALAMLALRYINHLKR